jgi:hypothetical protein
MEPTTGQRLILNDGTTLENAEAGYANGVLWCYVPGITTQQAAALFFDPAKTQKIIFQYGEMQNVYEGFTVVTAMLQDEDQVSIGLRKGA